MKRYVDKNDAEFILDVLECARFGEVVYDDHTVKVVENAIAIKNRYGQLKTDHTFDDASRIARIEFLTGKLDTNND